MVMVNAGTAVKSEPAAARPSSSPPGLAPVTVIRTGVAAGRTPPVRKTVTVTSALPELSPTAAVSRLKPKTGAGESVMVTESPMMDTGR